MIKNLNTNGLMNAQDALVAIMIAGGASDENISNRELISISRIVDHLPIFKSYDPSKIKIIAETVFDLFLLLFSFKLVAQYISHTSPLFQTAKPKKNNII